MKATDPAGAAEAVRSAVLGAKAQERAGHCRRAAQEAMGALLLAGGDLPGGAVAILTRMAGVAAELHADPAQVMTWVIEGMARALESAPPSAVDQVEQAINEAFMGAGGAFRQARRRAG